VAKPAIPASAMTKIVAREMAFALCRAKPIQTTDVDARQGIYEQAVAKACDEAYFLFMLNINDVYGMSERVQWESRVDAKILVKDMTVTG